MSEKKVVEALVSGGQATAGPPLGPTLGPLGLNVLAVVKKINELTESYAGMKVPVKIAVDVNNKEFEVSVGIPTTSALIVRQLGISKGSGAPNTEAKEVLGSCASMGVTVDGKEPTTVQQEIDAGAYDEFLNDRSQK